MIVDSKDKSVDELGLPTEAPPAYDELDFPAREHVASNNTAIPTSRSRLSHQFSRRERPAPATNRNTNVGRNERQKLHRPVPSSASKAPKHAKPALSGTLSPKAQADVRETIRGLVRDVVQGSSPVRSSASAALGVLESCAAACSAHSISFARILQERSIEHHAPIYWAIVSRPSCDEGPSKVDNREDDAFLAELLTHAAPLTLSSVSELRVACLVASNNELFQRLRSVPSVIPLSGTDRMLLQSTGLQTSDNSDQNDLEKVSLRKKTGKLIGFNDIIIVREGEIGSYPNAFNVDFQLKLFQRRMRVSGLLEVEFIARGRLWQLIFFVVPPRLSNTSPSTYKGTPVSAQPFTDSVPPAVLAAARHRGLASGSWALALTLLEGSTQCYAEARFTIPLQGKKINPDKSLPPPPGHSSRSTTSLRSANDSPVPNVSPRPPLPRSPGSSSSSPESKPSRRSFFRRTASEDKTKSRTRPAIVLNLRSSETKPLTAQPTQAWNDPSALLSEESDSFSLEVSRDPRRMTKTEKRTARKIAAKQQREREGRETKKDLKERARLAETVMLVGFEEPLPGAKSGKKDEGVKPEELMYDGCPYISPDGTLWASLEARLSNSPLESKDTDCVIC